VAAFNLLLKVTKKNPKTFSIFGDAMWHHLVNIGQNHPKNPKNLLKFGLVPRGHI
jgi:hypothetical protein